MKNYALVLLATLSLGLSKDIVKADQRSESTDHATSSIETEIRLARERVLKGREYKNTDNPKTSKIRLEIKPYQQTLEEPPDWWSEKQSFDLSILLAKALNYYPDLEVSPVQTWESALIKKELEPNNSITQPGNNLAKSSKQGIGPRLYGLLEKSQETYEIIPSITGYSFKYLRPKKQGIGLGFIAITNKSCTAESWLASSYEIKPLNPQAPQQSTISSLEQSGTFASIQIAELIQKTTGGTSLNINFLFGGAGGGDFEPPEKATKEIIYDTIVDAAEKIHCSLNNNTQCLSFYENRVQVKPTIEKKIPEKRGLFGKKIDDKKRGC